MIDLCHRIKDWLFIIGWFAAMILVSILLWVDYEDNSLQ